MKRADLSRTIILILCLYGVFCRPRFVSSAESITINFADTLGTFSGPVASGFTPSWADIIPDSLIYPLKPSAVRAQTAKGSPTTARTWERAEHTNAVLIIVLSDRLDTDPGDHDYNLNGEFWSAAAYDGKSYSEKMQAWIDHIRRWIVFSTEHQNYDVQVQYDILNEPDIWRPDSVHYGNPRDLFFDLWNRTWAEVKYRDPSAKVTGPSFAYAGNGPASSVMGSGITFNMFLQRCKASNTLPDVLGAHNIGNSDYAAANSTDGPWNLYAQIVDMRDKVASVGLNPDSFKYEINEMSHYDLPNPGVQQNHIPNVYPSVTPGVIVRQFALAERARGDHLGLILAARAFWRDKCAEGQGIYPVPGYGCYLSSLVNPCAVEFSPPQFLRRYAWWTYKAYADVSPRYVRPQSPDSLDAVAGVTAAGDTARILLGRYTRSSRQDLTLTVQNIDQRLVVNEAIRVSIYRMLGD